MADWFKPIHSKARQRRVVAFDIEGAGGEGGFVCGAIATGNVIEFYEERAPMWRALLRHGRGGAWLFAHNLEYDLPVVAGRELLDGSLIFKQDGMLWADYPFQDHRVRIFDSLNLFPRWSVADMGRMVGLPKLETSDGLMALLTRPRGWAGLDRASQQTVRAYCMRDAEIVQRAVEALQEEALSIGGELKPTIAGISMDVFRRRFHRWPYPALDEAQNLAARPAFYGGRVENFAVGQVPHVNMYDANSLYPAVQAGGRFPHPSHLCYEDQPRPDGGYWKWQGIAEVTVTAPPSFIPPLPYRHLGRLFFPTGRMRGAWPLSELRAARERGAVIESVEWVVGTDVTFNPFEDFVETLYARRQGYLAEGNARHALLKLILNSLYGRFGLNPDHALYRLIRLPQTPDWSALRGYTTSEWNDEVVAYGEMPSWGMPSYVNVLFAAQIASDARLRLTSALLGEGERAIYCDTDSLLTTGALPVGEGLGEWRQQMSDGTADIIGLKEYSLHNEVMGDRYVAKGVPSRAMKEYLRDGSARFKRALRVREAIASGRNPSEWVETLRTRGQVFPKRRLESAAKHARGEPCLTFAWRAEELPELLAGNLPSERARPQWRGRGLPAAR